MKYKFIFFSLMLASYINFSFASSGEIHRLVLVTNVTSGVSSLSSNEARRLFLGFPVVKNGHSLEAAINHSDPFLYEVFLQKVVYMSSSVYERHLLTNIVQLGGQRPQTYNDKRSLINTLKESPGTIALLWAKDASAVPNLVVLGEIWHGNVE